MKIPAMTSTRATDTARGLPDREEIVANKIARANTLKWKENNENYEKELGKKIRSCFVNRI